jgi:hypothetical protein
VTHTKLANDALSHTHTHTHTYSHYYSDVTHTKLANDAEDAVANPAKLKSKGELSCK